MNYSDNAKLNSNPHAPQDPPKEMHPDEILPCPWCGERRVNVSKFYYLKPMWATECENCNARSGLVLDKDNALDAWNDRVKINEKGEAR